MNVIKVKNKEEMSQLAAKHIIKKVTDAPHSVLGLATGSTPKETYKELVKDYIRNGTDYSLVKTINLDEYVGLSSENKSSYHYFMKKHLFGYLNIKENNRYIPNGETEDLKEVCLQYDQLIEKMVVDLQLLGIGRNGHIGFNEPGTSFNTKTHVVKLAHATRQSNSRFFNSIDEVPTHAITMGISSILKSKEILLLVSGSHKAPAMKHLIENEAIDVQFPASALKKHHHVTIIADCEALSLVSSYVGEN